jgi:hypothetical protein
MSHSWSLQKYKDIKNLFLTASKPVRNFILKTLEDKYNNIKIFDKKYRQMTVIQRKQYLKNNEHRLIEYQKNYRIVNDVTLKGKAKLYRLKNKEKLYQYRQLPEVKLRALMRSNVNRAVNLLGVRKSTKSYDYFGCSPTDLKLHIEKQFKPGMSWKNRKNWHIDHIKPICAFTKEDVMKVNHYTNLQPLWRQENLSKGSKH